VVGVGSGFFDYQEGIINLYDIITGKNKEAVLLQAL